MTPKSKVWYVTYCSKEYDVTFEPSNEECLIKEGGKLLLEEESRSYIAKLIKEIRKQIEERGKDSM